MTYCHVSHQCDEEADSWDRHRDEEAAKAAARHRLAEWIWSERNKRKHCVSRSMPASFYVNLYYYRLYLRNGQYDRVR